MRLRIALLLLLCTAPAYSAEVTEQVLDRVYTFSTSAVVDVKFGNIGTTDPVATNLHLSSDSALNFATCTVTTVGGVYCLDGQIVRRWANPQQPSEDTQVLNCASDLGVALAKGEGCVAMTVDKKNQIWLAVKKKNSHSVYKFTPPGVGACPPSTVGFCRSEAFFGRPPIVDLVPIEGDLAIDPTLCPNPSEPCGVVGIEERKSAVFFPNYSSVATTLVRATDWNLQGKELLQEIAPLVLGADTATPKLGLLATTTTGRVLARAIPGTGSARVIPFPATFPGGAPNLASCATTGAQFGIRASTTTGNVYISDRNCYRLLSFEPTGSTFSTVGLNYINHYATITTNPVPPATAPVPPVTHYVIGLALAPGISIDLGADCGGSGANPGDGCALSYGGGGRSAQLLNVQLGSGSATGATVFQILHIPDCRMVTETEFDPDLIDDCNDAVDLFYDANGNPVTVGNLAAERAKLRLNVKSLLPQEVRDAFAASGLGTELPPLLISRYYRAQARNGYAFDAFFILPQPGVRFVNTYDSEYEVGVLEGGLDTDAYDCEDPTNPDGVGHTLIQWDITTHVSEIHASIGGKYVDTLANVGCGSIRGAAGDMSLLSYNLQVSPDTWNPATDVTTVNNDAVFARLLQDLYGELQAVRVLYACTGAAGSPIGTSTCTTLESIWQNGKIKLDKCINAAFQPKNSASNENCQSWVSQLTNYRNALPATTLDSDLANRVGEQKARIQTLFHLYYDRFQPSIQAGGFCRETTNCGFTWPE